MRSLIILLSMLCLLCITNAQNKNEQNVNLSKESAKPILNNENLIMNPFMEEAGMKMIQHPTIPNVYIIEPVEEPQIVNRKPAKAAGCDAILTYVGHDNEWALIPESHLPQTFQFFGSVNNGGDVDLTNVQLKVTVYNSSNTAVFTATSDPVATLEVGSEEEEITIIQTFDFTVKDNYYIEYEVIHDCSEPDDNTYDNVLYRWVQISDNVMAKFTDNIPINSSNYIFGEGNIGMLVKMDRDEILTGISYKTYSVSAANPARAAVYEVEVEDFEYEIWDWVYYGLDENDEEIWEFELIGTYIYDAIVDYELIAKSDDGITMKFEAYHDYYLPIDRALDNPTHKGVKLENGKSYIIASDGNMITTANTLQYKKQAVWGKANVGDNQDFQLILKDALAMVRMHFGEEELLQNVDAGVKEIITPKTTHAIPSMFSIAVDVKNYGKQPISSGLTVHYQYNSEPVVDKEVTAEIAPFQTSRVTFSELLNLYAPETATLKVWTTLAGDTNTENDEIVSVIEMVNPNYSFNFELPDWNFYSWNATASRNRFAPWITTDEDAEPVKSIYLANNYFVAFNSMGAQFGGGNVSNNGRRSFQGITPSLTSPTLINYVTPHGGKKVGWVASPAGQAKDWLISPKVKLNTNSSVELWAMALDGGSNEEKMRVLISTTDNALASFFPVSGENAVTIPKTWTYFSYDLSDYDEQEVYVAIQYYSNDQLFAAFDDILIKTDFVAFTDLEVVSVASPTNITEKKLTFSIRNNGNKPVEEALTLSYKLNSENIVTIPFEAYPINTGASKTITFPEDIELPVGVHTFKIWTNYVDDNNRTNDTLIYKVEINPVANSFKLTFEEFIDFSENYYPWSNLDLDRSLSYNLGNPDNPLSYFKEWTPIGFITFNPKATIPASTNRFQAYEGDKFGASIRVWNPTNVNNDWLISPKTSIPEEGFNYITMMVKSSYSENLENFNVLVSTTNATPSSFTALNEEILLAPTEWTEVAYQLNDYMGQDIHVAIQTSSTTELFYGQMFMIDNVEIVLNEAEKTEASVIEVLFPTSYPKLPFTDVPVKVKIANTGNTDITPVSISMQLNSETVITENYEGEMLNWKQKVDFEFAGKINLTYPGINVLKVWVNYENGSSVPFERTIYINPPQNSMFIDFEDAYDFTTVLSPWENDDVDGQTPVTFTLILSDGTYQLKYPGYDEPQSFVVFNPSETSVPNLINYIRPHSGDRIAVSVHPVEGNSDDWFVSPKNLLYGNSSKVSFFARGLAAAYTEKFEVWVLIPDGEITYFSKISGDQPVELKSASWTEFEYSLDEFNGQEVCVAISCVSGSNGAIFMIDDIEITTTNVNIEKNRYSNISVVPNPTSGKLYINSANKIKDIEIVDITGKSMMSEKINSFSKNIDISSLQSGLYFIRINTGSGIEVMKIVKQ